jgi:hypothetical protein
MTLDVATIRASLDILARTTWSDLSDGWRLSIGMGETSITDRNLLALRRQHPTLLMHKHAAHEEVRTGADWEWWIASREGWISLVFQAKRLDSNLRYSGLTAKQPNGTRQVDSLIKTCWNRSVRLGGAVAFVLLL